jgi:uncharacterized membrane protein YphA (DoxX/SURF4 family)
MKRAITIIVSVLLTLLFLYAAYYKLKDYHTFVTQLSLSPITGGYENILAWLIPSLEIILAISLLFNRTRLKALWGAFFLMLLFTTYIFVLTHFFINPGCSCGGIISKLSWKGHFYFDLGFTLLAGMALSLMPEKQKAKKQLRQTDQQRPLLSPIQKHT